MTLQAIPVEGLPEIEQGFDLGAAVVTALTSGPAPEVIRAGDVLVVAHKVISKREGRVRALSSVKAGARAIELAARVGKDPRHVQVILDDAREVIRSVPGVLIVETRHGFICANAGVDASNVPGEDRVVLLPLDPDRSARELRARVAELTGISPGVVVTDSFGRAWRTGQVDVAIGCAGVAALDDWRGGYDANGRELRATVIAVADELAAAADLARAKDGQQPVVLVRGASQHVTEHDGPGATPLIRAREQDLFR